jgi:hypothetical protein
MTDADPHRRATDASMALAVTGYRDFRSLITNVIGGLVIAGLVGGIAAWRMQAVLDERVAMLREQMSSVQQDLSQIRRDFYSPRYGRYTNQRIEASDPP